MKMHWRSKIHPEVLDKYDEIMSQGYQTASPVKRPKSVLNAEDSPIQNYDLTPKKRTDYIKKEIDEKMRSLEEQNSNLRD